MSFNVFGHQAVERDDNSGLGSDEQQTVPEYVVYTTDDQLEAEEIVAAGGFVKQDDNKWYVATRYEDAVGGEFASEFDTPSKPLTQNSSAVIDEDGRVFTDPSFDPLQKSDVEGMIEYETAAAPERGRNDQPGFGGNRKIVP